MPIWDSREAQQDPVPVWESPTHGGTECRYGSTEFTSSLGAGAAPGAPGGQQALVLVQGCRGTMSPGAVSTGLVWGGLPGSLS